MPENQEEKQIECALAKKDFYFFVRRIFFAQYGYKWQQAPHHKIICDHLTRVFNGDCTRLILSLPPRYSKTQLVIYFIAWSLGKNPDSEFILTSYSSRLCANNSWQVRNIVGMEAYQDIFPAVKLQHDSKARDEWRTTSGGMVYAAGSGGSITGRGAGKIRDGFGGAIIVDDALKPDEALSETVRNGTNEWFQNTLESRKNSPHTPIVVIAQRLHENDLPGFLLGGGNGEQWESVVMPAIQEDGTALWPEKHDISKLREMEEANPYNFAAQYQQIPAPRTGGLFKPAQLHWLETLPNENITYWRGYDLASTTTGNWTVGLLMGKRPNGRYIIADVMRVRCGPDERDEAIRNTAAMDGKKIKISIPQDPGQAGKSLALYMTRDLAGYSVVTSPESGDKVTRAEPVASQINGGNVDIVRGPWNKALIDELATFPFGAHDDQVDAMSRAFSQLLTPNKITVSNNTLIQFRQRGRTA